MVYFCYWTYTCYCPGRLKNSVVDDMNQRWSGVIYNWFKHGIGMSSWSVEQSFFIPRRIFQTFSILDFKRIWVYIIWDILKEFKLNYGSFILRDRREAKDVKWLLISEWWSFMRSCCLFNILCSVSWALAGCLSESALRRKLALVSLIVFKVCFWCFDSLYDY